MAAPMIQLPELHTSEFPPAFTSFDVIEGEGALPRSRELLEGFFELSDCAQSIEKVEGEELSAIQEDVRSWAQEAGFLDIPETLEERQAFYTDFSEQRSSEKILGLVDYLERQHGDKVSQIELDATRVFIESTFANYNDQPREGVALDADGSHAFVVPARMGRDHKDYGREVELIPAFRYIPNELRAQMLAGLPPFVIDTYAEQNGKRGYLIFAPVFEDMRADLGESVSTLSRATNHNVNAAVDFAYHRFGITHVGLGASLPSHTRFGQKITNENVTVTTGHGGTIALINKILASTLEKTLPEAEQGVPASIGVLGLGAIGMRIAEITAQQYPDSKIHVYDPNPKLMEKAMASAPNIVAAENEREAIMSSMATISAIAGEKSQLDLEALGITNLEGRVIIDDSQPGSVNPLIVEKLGGAVVWAIGSDTRGKIVRRGYDYATMNDPHTDLFGCEAEVGSQALYEEELRQRGTSERVITRIMSKVAVRDAVTLQKVHYNSALFTKYGITPSQPQAFGRPVRIPPLGLAA